MVEFPRPKLQQVKQFLALLGYYRHFIEGFQYKAAPLYKLTHDDTKWVWDEIHEKTFIELKNLMILAPILIHSRETQKKPLTRCYCHLEAYTKISKDIFEDA